jgi:hypothetical protein
MKKVIIVITLVFLLLSTYSQPCLPDGIDFATQAQIDSFQVNYPNCTGIEGNVVIHGNDITNVDGLAVLTSIEGNLRIGGYTYWHNFRLSDISGLINLTTIGGGLSISYNDSLSSLAGLENLLSIGGGLGIAGNPLLNSIAELGGVTGTIELLNISDNQALTYLDGLEGITNINTDLLIIANHALTGLSGLQNLTNIGGYLRLLSNTSLSSLSGLSNIKSIGDYLKITQNDNLTDLTGLGGLTNIDSSLYITLNHGLTSLAGTDMLTSIGGDVYIQSNYVLTSLEGLAGVSSIGGRLWIDNNSVLKNLSGIDNIDANSIEDLAIWDNPLLDQCEVESICAYLVNPGGNIIINDNATGCNSPEEVQDSCEANAVNINEQYIRDNLLLYPNPAYQEVNISAEGITLDEVVFYTLTGQMVFQTRPKNNTIVISNLQPGMFIVEVTVEGRLVRKKLVVRQ